MALAAGNDLGAALEQFEKAVPVLLRNATSDNDGTGNQRAMDSWIKLILEDYIKVLGRIRGASLESRVKGGIAARAFALAQAASAQSVQRSLTASAARAAAKDSALADLVRRQQDTTIRLNALNGVLASALNLAADQRDDRVIADLRGRVDTLRRPQTTLAGEIGRRFPDYAALMNPKPTTIGQVQKSLRPGESLIATYVAEKETYVWAISRTGKTAFSIAPLGRDKLAKSVGKLRRALDPQVATLGGIPAFDTAASHDLYKALLGPVEAGWKDAKSLLVVAHGPLGQLPFSVLVTAPKKAGSARPPLFSNYREVPFLARSHAVTLLPSVASLATLRALPPATPARRNFAGFGDPWFSTAQAIAAAASTQETQIAALTARGLIAVRGLSVHLRSAPKLDGVSSADLAKLPRLPDTADEVRGIAVAMNADLKRDVFTGRGASEGRVKSMALSGYKVLAFATHGLVPGDLDGLSEPALALSSPNVVGGTDDGLLTMGEILSLKLDADWVVLSACNTASGNGAGAEAVSGLGRAFFYAGTRALLVSNWPVETTSAKALTTDIFKRQATDGSLSRADALRQSMLNLIDKGGLIDAKGNMVFSYAHPIFWAPFSLVGDGGGGKPAS
ncbi:MAG: CHAT domain-containing protein [Proteobacteria bacterium]|nr:CHAT domain-containing protein [Pseudomonadota bacterium]